MKYNATNFKKGQVLIITLLVLTILGILIVGVIAITNRDTQEVVSTEKYQEIYNYSETNLKAFVDAFGLYTTPLSALNSVSSCAQIITNTEYRCTVPRSDLGSISTGVNTIVTVSDTRDVRNFQVYKDRTLDLTLNGYRNTVNFTWTNQAAIEFNLIARTSTNNYITIRDVYENAPTSVFDSLGGYDHFGDPDNIHPFPFQVLTAGALSTTVRFNVANIVGLAATDTPLFISVTPRIRDGSPSSTEFTITPVSAVGYPNQMRVFVSRSYDAQDLTTPVAEVETKIPLTPQIDSIFDYGLITNGALTLI